MRFGSGVLAALLLTSAGSTFGGSGTGDLAAAGAPAPTHPRSDWLARKAAAVTRTPLSRAAFYAQVLGTIALAEDGHTDAYPSSPAAGVRVAVPEKFVAFPDGLYVAAAAAHYRRLLGARVLAIEGRPTGEVLDTVRAIVPSDNEWGKRELLEDYLRMPALLAALGVADSNPGLQVTIPSVGGGRKVVTIAPGDVEDAPARGTAAASDPRGVAGRSLRRRATGLAASPGPSLLVPGAAGAGRSLSPDQPVAGAGARRLCGVYPRPPGAGPRRTRAASRGPPDQPRRGRDHSDPAGRGRDPTLGLPIPRQRLRPHLHPDVLCRRAPGRRAGAQHSRHLRGEPTGAPPNHFADVQTVSLPNSGVEVEISALYWQKSDPRDERAAIYPDVEAPLTWEDFVAGRDPALAAIRTLDPDDPRLRRERRPVYNWLRESQRRN